MRKAKSAQEFLAVAMYQAENGHTGIWWEDLNEYAQEDWRKKADKVLEGMFSSHDQVLVIDIGDDKLYYAPKPLEYVPSVLRAKED